MRKRAKLTLPKLIKEILLQDVEYFGIKLETLCNLILKEMGYDQTLRIHDRIANEKKVILAFNLNEKNTVYFEDMLSESEENVEAEYFRRLLSTYANFHPSIRERVVRRELFREVEYAIKKILMIKIAKEKEVFDVLPVALIRDGETGYNILQVKVGGEILCYKVRDIELIKVI